MGPEYEITLCDVSIPFGNKKRSPVAAQRRYLSQKEINHLVTYL